MTEPIDTGEGAVWPPPPRNYSPHSYDTGKTPLTPSAATSFFLVKCMTYGATYGGVVGLLLGGVVFSVGVIVGALIGALFGFIGGINNGIILGCYAGYLARKDVPVKAIARKILWTVPFATALGVAGIVILLGEVTNSLPDILESWPAWAACAIAMPAAFHAAWIATRKFMEEYE